MSYLVIKVFPDIRGLFFIKCLDKSDINSLFSVSIKSFDKFFHILSAISSKSCDCTITLFFLASYMFPPKIELY